LDCANRRTDRVNAMDFGNHPLVKKSRHNDIHLEMVLHHRRVVVTGIGTITPLGNTLLASWKSLLRNEHGVMTLEEALRHQNLTHDALAIELTLAKVLPCQVAAPVRDVAQDIRTARFVHLALLAGDEAVKQAQLTFSGDFNPRIGACVGSGMSSVREIVQAATLVSESGIRRLSPHFVPKVLANSAAGRLSLEYNLGGPNLAPSTACAAGAHAIGDAMRCIQHNDADVMLAGGSESCIDPLSMAGFCRLRALSTSFPPGESSRPFDRLRDGFVMGEGAAILVLEELEHARARGAKVLAELRGYGLSGDGYHLTAPDPQGRGSERAMSMALQSAGMDASDIGYVNAHATSTPMGDDIEASTISRRMGVGRTSDLFVSSTKGATGHLLGAAGAVEAAFTIMALQDGILPPTRNLSLDDRNETEKEIAFRHVIESTEWQVDAAMTNSFGFGGTNASLIFSKM
jgi:3-oxoacyl-[acyl-carrier-protein] synthase II